MAGEVDVAATREQLKARIDRLGLARAAEPHEPRKIAPRDEVPPKREHDPDQVIAVFEGRPTPQPREIEVVEPIVEQTAAPERGKQRAGSGLTVVRSPEFFSRPGHAFIVSDRD